MTHGDNSGLVLPPKVAPVQVDIIPIHAEEGQAFLISAMKLRIFSRQAGHSQLRLMIQIRILAGSSQSRRCEVFL